MTDTDTLAGDPVQRMTEANLWLEYSRVCEKISALDPFAAFSAMSRADLESYLDTEVEEGTDWVAAPPIALLIEHAGAFRVAGYRSIQYDHDRYTDEVREVFNEDPFGPHRVNGDLREAMETVLADYRDSGAVLDSGDDNTNAGVIAHIRNTLRLPGTEPVAGAMELNQDDDLLHELTIVLSASDLEIASSMPADQEVAP